jgi:hypothetical protein
MKEPDDDPDVLDAYCYSPEGQGICREYNLQYPHHYNQPAMRFTPGQRFVISSIHMDKYVKKVNGDTVWMFRLPCLRAVKNEKYNHIDIRVTLDSPKTEIMQTFETVLDKVLKDKDEVGKKTKKRGIVVEDICFEIWDMHNKDGLTFWNIAEKLYPEIKEESPYDFDDNFSKRARSRVRQVERAFEKAHQLIASITKSA